MSEEDQYQKAVEEIITDLKDRRGFNQFWHDIDSDIKDEIKETYRDILKGYFEDNIKRIDGWGEHDWYIFVDENGNRWIRPSLDWNDGMVYKSKFTMGDEIYNVLEKLKSWEQ